MKKLLIRIILFISPLLLVMTLLNIFYDPANIFSGGKYEKGVSDILLAGKNVANISNYDERLVQKFYFKDLVEAKDVIVLGSSRAMQIDGRFVKKTSFYNAGVSGATIEDIVSITQLMAMNEVLPKKVIIGVDPWFFNVNNGQSRWETLKSEYNSFFNINVNNVLGINYTKHLNLISLSYYQYSLLSYIKGIRKSEYYTTDKNDLDVDVKKSNGTRLYKISYRNASIDDIVLDCNYYINNGLYGLKRFSAISKEYTDKFESLIMFYLNRDIEVVLFLAPYNPIVYNYIESEPKYSNVIKVEEYLKRFAGVNSIDILGSYNPNIYKFEPISFHDSMHPKTNTVEMIFNDY